MTPRLLPALVLAAGLGLATAATGAGPKQDRLPWRAAGLDERQAASHLLDRFAFGARPGEIERMLEMGLERWLEIQLAGSLDDSGLERRLESLRTLDLPTEEIVHTFPPPGLVRAELVRSGELPPPGDGDEEGEAAREELRQAMMEHYRENGLRPQRQLLGELMASKLWRAVYTENQLHEVLTDFWFNHFNVALADNEARVYIAPYERDAIRPHVLGSFRDLLGATARHPAMLLYLDNARSWVDEGRRTTFEERATRRGVADRRLREAARQRRAAGGERMPRGLNENYARELLELHTLGVDGGYTQEDVVEVARAMTGWTVLPPGPARQRMESMLDRAASRGGRRFGLVREGEFVFNPQAHDAERKQVLGRSLAAGRGIEDGEEVLDLLAAHRSTAHHLARKLAVRFVSDDPPAALVDRLAETFSRTGGDIGAVVRSIAYSPEFWSPEARRQKIKSPFELAVSALRALDAEVRFPFGVLQWIARMGQPLYAYEAPTGYPDRAEAWVSPGALLNRMNFGLQLAAGRIYGVRVDLPALVDHREPESLAAALDTCARRLLPGRDLDATLELLAPLAHDAELARKVEHRAAPAAQDEAMPWGLRDEALGMAEPAVRLPEGPSPDRRRSRRAPAYDGPTSPLAQVVGVILGSPEFQRR